MWWRPFITSALAAMTPQRIAVGHPKSGSKTLVRAHWLDGDETSTVQGLKVRVEQNSL